MSLSLLSQGGETTWCGIPMVSPNELTLLCDLLTAFISNVPSYSHFAFY